MQPTSFVWYSVDNHFSYNGEVLIGDIVLRLEGVLDAFGGIASLNER